MRFVGGIFDPQTALFIGGKKKDKPDKDCLSRKYLLLKSVRSFGSVGQLTRFRLHRLCQTEKRGS